MSCLLLFQPRKGHVISRVIRCRCIHPFHTHALPWTNTISIKSHLCFCCWCFFFFFWFSFFLSLTKGKEKRKMIKSSEAISMKAGMSESERWMRTGNKKWIEWDCWIVRPFTSRLNHCLCRLFHTRRRPQTLDWLHSPPPPSTLSSSPSPSRSRSRWQWNRVSRDVASPRWPPTFVSRSLCLHFRPAGLQFHPPSLPSPSPPSDTQAVSEQFHNSLGTFSERYPGNLRAVA